MSAADSYRIAFANELERSIGFDHKAHDLMTGPTSSHAEYQAQMYARLGQSAAIRALANITMAEHLTTK